MDYLEILGVIVFCDNAFYEKGNCLQRNVTSHSSFLSYSNDDTYVKW